MDPITLGIAAVGIGMQLFGGVGASSTANKIAQQQQALAVQTNQITGNISNLEASANAQQQQMNLVSARRAQTENFRNIQRARAQGVNSATNQGAQFGSGLKGGQAQATDQGTYSNLGISQNLQNSQILSGINNQVSGQKQILSNITTDANVNLSGLQSNMVTDQSISALGGTLTKSAGTLGNIFGGDSFKLDLSGFGFNPIKGASGQ